MCVCECACVGGTERCTAAESTGSVGCERAGAEETVWEQAAGHGQTDRRKGVWRMETGGQAGRHTASPPRCPPRALLTLQVQPLVPPSIPALPRHCARIPHQLNPPQKARCWLLSFTCAAPTGLHSCLGKPLTFQTTTTQPHQLHAARAAAPEQAAAAFLRGGVNAGPCVLNS